MNDTQIQKSYYSVTPADVRYSKNIVDGAKLLYGEISALCNERGYCWASNKYFADLYNNETRTIARWIASLVKEGFIYVNTSKGVRKIFLCHKFPTPEINTAETEQVDEEHFAESTSEPEKKSKKAKKEKKEVATKFTDDDLFLAELLLQKIIYNFPTFENKQVKIKDWADDIRKIREIEKASRDQINFMIIWLQGGEFTAPGKNPKKFEPHDFWAKNILSAGKLRKQWFTLIPQLQQELKLSTKKSTVTQL